jgi:ribonuclease E
MVKEMLINTVDIQECRIAIVEDGRLEELYIERASSASHVGNIYKGRVTNVEAAIQAAFVDFGLGKNGFLHISDVHPKFFPHGRGGQEPVGQKRAHRDRPPIQECLRRGQEVIVQMTKEGIGTKGPTLTTYLSIPGRLLVMMPGMSRLGVSRKIDDDGARSKAKDLLEGLKLPGDMGFIVRTAGLDRNKREFQRDLNYLTWLWKSITQKIKNSKNPSEIYQESDLVSRTIRDVYNADINRIICDSEPVARKVEDFLEMVMPKTKHTVELYTGDEGLFQDSGLEGEIEKIYSRRVEMPSGGSLVIDQTEALVAIDVNSGRFRDHSDAETTALKMNQEAAKEIARQLRIRDLGGVIVIDFIDMREERNRRAVEKTLKEAMKPDRAKTKVLRISSFGMIEMTRQRVRPSLKHSIFRTCRHCEGAGLVKSEESLALLVMRDLHRAIANDDVAQIDIAASPAVEQYLANQQRHAITKLEEQTGKTILIKADPLLSADQVRLNCMNARGSIIAWDAAARRPGKAAVRTAALPPRPPGQPTEYAPEQMGEIYEEPADETPQGTEDTGITAGNAGVPPATDGRVPVPFAGQNQRAPSVSDGADRLAPTVTPAQPHAPGQAGISSERAPGVSDGGMAQALTPGQAAKRPRRRGGRGRRRGKGRGLASPAQPVAGEMPTSVPQANQPRPPQQPQQRAQQPPRVQQPPRAQQPPRPGQPPRTQQPPRAQQPQRAPQPHRSHQPNRTPQAPKPPQAARPQNAPPLGDSQARPPMGLSVPTAPLDSQQPQPTPTHKPQTAQPQPAQETQAGQEGQTLQAGQGVQESQGAQQGQAAQAAPKPRRRGRRGGRKNRRGKTAESTAPKGAPGDLLEDQGYDVPDKDAQPPQPDAVPDDSDDNNSGPTSPLEELW